MQVLSAKNIVKRFPGVVALDHVDFAIERGEIHCIVGENGAGKSTLIKVLTGNYYPEEGELQIFGKNPFQNRVLFKKISYVPQEIDLFSQLTVAENLFMPYSTEIYRSNIVNLKKLYEKSQIIIDKYHINASPDAKTGELSVSDQQLIQIAHAVDNQSAEIILLDEPTTSLVTDDIERLFKVIADLKNKGKSIVFISHKLEEVFRIGDIITVLRNGQKISSARTNEVSIDWVIEKMVGQELDPNAIYRPKANKNPKILLKIKNITGKGYRNISFDAKEGEILGFAGLLGSGRSEIAQGIIGYKPFWKGSIVINEQEFKSITPMQASRLGIVYLPEERKKQGIFPYLSVKQNLSIMVLKELKKWLFISSKKENQTANELVQEYNIKTITIENKIMFLSGGNQQKSIIARAMKKKPNILIFDEPTKGIDVGAKAEIYKLMKDLVENYNIAIILISSEIEEVIKCSNRIIVLYKGRVIDEYDSEKFNKSDIISSMIGQPAMAKIQCGK